METVYQLTGYHTLNLIIQYYDTYYTLPCDRKHCGKSLLYLLHGTSQWYNTKHCKNAQWPMLTIKGDNRGNPALTKRFYGFDSRLVEGPGHIKDVKDDSGPCLQLLIKIPFFYSLLPWNHKLTESLHRNVLHNVGHVLLCITRTFNHFQTTSIIDKSYQAKHI